MQFRISLSLAHAHLILAASPHLIYPDFLLDKFIILEISSILAFPVFLCESAPNPMRSMFIFSMLSKKPISEW